jgi:signal peptide peptidase SppA
MHPQTFRSSFFALSPLAVPTLIAANKPELRQPKLTAGQIGVFGVLGQNDWFTDTDYSAIRSGVQRALADPNAKTVDLVIDSPGGSVLGLPETADVIHAANRVKPVRAFVTGIAASAAYWLASQASTVTLTPSGEVGSVGVLDIHADITQALANSGVKLTAVTAGEYKTERAPFVSLTDDAKAHMQDSVNAWYGEFLGAIRRGRGARVSASSNYGGGRMFGSRDALAAGLVDFITTL